MNVAGTPPDRVVRFTVRGEPRSKQRPRVTARGTFTPKETLAQERKVRDAWLATKEAKFEYSVVMEMKFYNYTRHRRDIDNMAKLVLDGLNKFAFDDDVQVVGLHAEKVFTNADRARTEVCIREVIMWANET